MTSETVFTCETLLHNLIRHGQAQAICTETSTVSYSRLIGLVEAWRECFAAAQLEPGEIVAFRGEFSPSTVSLLLALMADGHIAVPLAENDSGLSEKLEVSGASRLVDTASGPDAGSKCISKLDWQLPNPLVQTLRKRRNAGIVVFSSGTTGKSKAALFDFEVLCQRYRRTRKARRTLAFLYIDHLGGINTLFHTLCGGGTVVVSAERNPDGIARCIERLSVEVLPTTPTFLRVLLLSRADERHDLSSLELISYGTEPMPESTLSVLSARFPEVVLKQTYGLSELGVLPTRTPDSQSLWLEVGGLGCEVKVVEGVLHIRSETAMMGYLNAPSPFDEEGWYNTHDLVETNGSLIRFLGRVSDVINVGGEKVHPVQVENTLLQLSNIEEATVWGRRNSVTGQVVAARVTLCVPEDRTSLEERLFTHCRAHLAGFQVPAFVEISDASLMGTRLKKTRPTKPTIAPQTA